MTDFGKKVISNSSLLWMFRIRAVNQRKNRLHERRLEALPNDETLTFKDTLSKSKETTIHAENIQKLMTDF